MLLIFDKFEHITSKYTQAKYRRRAEESLANNMG